MFPPLDVFQQSPALAVQTIGVAGTRSRTGLPVCRLQSLANDSNC